MKHIAIIILYVITLNAQTIYVGSCGTPNQTTIQNAINTAISGDTVSICDNPTHKGYEESVIVDKSLTITSYNQDSTKVTINGKNSSTATIRITNGANTNITHITIENNQDDGIDIQSDVDYIRLDNVVIKVTGTNAFNVKNIVEDFNITSSTIESTKGNVISFYNEEYVKNFYMNNSSIKSDLDTFTFKSITGNFYISNSTINSKTQDCLRFTNPIVNNTTILNNNIISDAQTAISFESNISHFTEITNNFIDAKQNKDGKYGIYIDSSNTHSNIKNNQINGGDIGLYIRVANADINIEDNNFTNSKTHFLKILNQTQQKSVGFKVYGNCFTKKTDVSNYDTSAKFNNSNYGNYWGSCPTDYKISIDGQNDVLIYDYLPLKNCGSLELCNPNWIPAFKFDAYDTTRSLSDRNISTKIISQDFNLTIAETNSTDFNGTLCATIDKATWKKLLFSNSHESIASFNQAKSKKNAQIYMEWAYNKNLSCPLNLNDGNSTYSTDNFAIRPQSFSITSPNDKNASEVFSISFLANSATDYNETINSSFSIDYNITKAGCNNGVLYIPNASFSDGNLTFDTNFSEIGELNITISEKNATSFALVDNDDTPDTQRIITKASKLINFTPYELNIIDFSYTNTNGKNWLYMDDLLEQNTTISFKVKAQNKAHESLINFDKNCYAKEVNVSLSFTPDVNLSLLTELNTTKILNDTNFTNGTSEQVSYIYNIKREIGKPLNPMDINLSEINTTNPNIINLGLNLDKNSTKYYYGRVHSPDYKIYEPITVNAIYEVYCKSCSDKNSSWISSVDDYYWYKISNDIFATYTLTKTETKEIPSSKYLRYNIFAEDINNSFFVERLTTPSPDSWDGVGKHVDLNVSKRSNNRIEW